MNRKGRSSLPKVHQDAPAPTGFEHGAYTIEGNVERMGAFARGVNRTSGAGRWTTRIVVAAFALLLLAAVLVPLVKSVF
jgi:hypothetical protein